MNDEPPDDEAAEKPKKRHLRSITGGGGQTASSEGKSTAAGSGDDEFFKLIMKELRKFERQNGSVPTIAELSITTGMPMQKITEILWKYLPDLTADGSTEFSTNLKRMLLGPDRAEKNMSDYFIKRMLLGPAQAHKNMNDYLREQIFIKPEEWHKVIVEQEKTGDLIIVILFRLGLASQTQLKNALEMEYSINYVALSEVEMPVLECLQLLPEALMRKHLLVPVLIDGTRVTLAMVNPNNLVALDEVRILLKGLRIKLNVCTIDDFQPFMNKVSKLLDPHG